MNLEDGDDKTISEESEVLDGDGKTKGIESQSMKFNINEVIAAIEATGLIYEPMLIKRFACSLMTKPFVILSGLSGSGKTQLALAFARAMCKDVKEQICFVAVGADWTNREQLLGFPNALKLGDYVKPDNKALDLLICANQNPQNPYFLVLDEMNLSYVERYFADFLSAMESHMPINLWDAPSKHPIPSSIDLPPNLYIIGTINVDETTYMFSPKVLDRANVIEFKIKGEEMDKFLQNVSKVDITRADSKCSSMVKDFLENSEIHTNPYDAEIRKVLLDFFIVLKSVNAEYGYRTATEIFRYIQISRSRKLIQEINETDVLNSTIDAAIVQKFLPKLHGSRKQVAPILNKLWKLCYKGESDACPNLDQIDFTEDLLIEFKYPISADKIKRMYKAAVDNGFMSFAEA